MKGLDLSACATLILVLACAGCATSPEVQERTRATEEEIESILSQPLEAAEYGETKRCLAGNEYRNFRVLDDQRILFEGRGGKFWLNTLRTRCPDLRFATALRVKSMYSYGRICDMDTFQPTDWFDWPWYRRWPWDWRNRPGTGMTCSLGKFQPVTGAQVESIEAALRR
ncbi:MAG: hypothetical protein KDI31_07760 [Pseudomonadales bacterium]|nr:hypothetical protein [Pseudomonadales bacterium]